MLPALININEPLLFGAPVVFNPYLAVPFVVAPMVHRDDDVRRGRIRLGRARGVLRAVFGTDVRIDLHRDARPARARPRRRQRRDRRRDLLAVRPRLRAPRGTAQRGEKAA